MGLSIGEVFRVSGCSTASTRNSSRLLSRCCVSSFPSGAKRNRMPFHDFHSHFSGFVSVMWSQSVQTCAATASPSLNVKFQSDIRRDGFCVQRGGQLLKLNQLVLLPSTECSSSAAIGIQRSLLLT